MAQERWPSGGSPGRGRIDTRAFGSDVSQASWIASTSPLKLVSPAGAKDERAVLVFALNHGGGLVAGDQIHVDINVHDGSRLGFLTQGSTKIYRSLPGAGRSMQAINATVGSQAALLILPDPVQPFRDSIGAQHQQFHIHPTESNLLVLDWVTEGRTARGERWCFTEWESRNEVWSSAAPQGQAGLSDKRLLLRDTVNLSETSGPGMQPIADRMGEIGVFGTIIIRGTLFQSVGELFLQQFACLPRIGSKQWSATADTHALEDVSDGKLLKGATEITWTATSARGFVIVRFGARRVEMVRHWLREVFRHDGTVEREFGKRYLFCLQDH